MSGPVNMLFYPMFVKAKGFYADKKARDKAYKKLAPLFGENLIKAKTVVQ